MTDTRSRACRASASCIFPFEISLASNLSMRFKPFEICSGERSYNCTATLALKAAT
jgi:hypothetical protein